MSRVASLNGVTIPRLQLCAPVLLKKLYVESKPQFEFPIKKTFLWSNATILLFWVKKDPHLLKTFKANRDADIQTSGDRVHWRNVRSDDNPADATLEDNYHQILLKILFGLQVLVGQFILKKNGLGWLK
ncbi:uncharacterized protein LOC117178424 [Belonocnema kinseyi]|uniref:uncharacterized protein LOC117178424 n=1 Tax=Belonocnema kinseyi TaxID=2817044 RepID=UPI00143CDACB|nr:uncharacterized protein LOC117178424 [Belonocnema kinseyi]